MCGNYGDALHFDEAATSSQKVAPDVASPRLDTSFFIALLASLPSIECITISIVYVPQWGDLKMTVFIHFFSLNQQRKNVFYHMNR